MNDGRELGWDDAIENDGQDFITLPEGEYNFFILGFERGRYAGGAKMGPCNKAMIGVELDGGDLGKATITENLFLHTKTEGILCSFFRSIGARKSGDKMVMDWNKVAGSKGRCKVSIRTYEKDGEKRQINQVKSWLDPVEAPPADAGFQAGTF